MEVKTVWQSIISNCTSTIDIRIIAYDLKYVFTARIDGRLRRSTSWMGRAIVRWGRRDRCQLRRRRRPEKIGGQRIEGEEFSVSEA